MSKVYNIPLECHFFKELAQIVACEKDLTKVFLPNNRSCRAFRRELSKFNCISPEIISISDILNFPDINFILLKFLKDNTVTVPFSTLFDLAESLSTLIRNLIFNKADYKTLMIPEKFNETWEKTLLILDQVFQKSEILDIKNMIESRLNIFFSSLEGENFAVAGLLEENFYNRLLYSKALDSGVVVVSGLEKTCGENYKKINRLFQNKVLSQVEEKSSRSEYKVNRRFLELANNLDEAQAIALATRKMIEVNNSNDDYEISGFISYPDAAKTAKSNINITPINKKLFLMFWKLNI